MQKWLKTPKGHVSLAMIAYLLLASVGSRDAQGLVLGLVAIGAALATDVLFSLVRRRKRIVPDGALITGAIIALILSTSTSLLHAALTSVIAIGSKHLLLRKRKPIFNPAAFGLLVSVYVFHLGHSWWGSFADLPVWMTVFLFIGGYVVANRVSKFPQMFAFMAVYLLLLLPMGLLEGGDAVDALRPPFINAALFFAFFMLTDPPTSPAKTKDQVLFGGFVAVIGAVVYALFGGLNYFFIGLLAGNALFHLRALLAERKNRMNFVSLR